MPNWFQRQPLAISLAVLAAVLLVAIGLEVGFGTGLQSALSTASPKKAASSEAKLLPPVIATAPEQAYPETAARPLFTPTRRPAPEAASTAQTAFKRDQFTLQGVIVVGDNRVAMLREKASGRIHRVELGGEVNGVKVVEIQPEVVTLGSGSEREQLSLMVAKQAGAPPATQLGPFGPAAPGAPGAPAAAAAQPAQPAATAQATEGQAGAAPANPLARTTQGTFFNTPPQPVPGQAAPAQPATAPMTPEELLARRRARRSQQSQ